MRSQKENGIGQWRKGHLCYKVAKTLSDMCLRYRSIFRGELGYLTEKYLKVLRVCMAWLLLTASSKMQDERNKLKRRFTIKREREFKHLENAQTGHVIKNEKVCSYRTKKTFQANV